MKSKKWLLGAGVTLSAALLLAACGKSDKKQMPRGAFLMFMQWIRLPWIIALRVKVLPLT